MISIESSITAIFVAFSSSIIACTPFGAEHLAHYACSKAAVYTLTQLMARALGSSGINVNAIAPGFTASEASLGMVDDSVFKSIAAGRCLQRRQEAEELVGTAVSLASKDSDFIIGQVLIVDGGSWLK